MEKKILKIKTMIYLFLTKQIILLIILFKIFKII